MTPHTTAAEPARAEAPPAPFLRSLWDHHLDELGFLFGQWRQALTDRDHTLESVGELEERILAHLDGVRVPGDAALPLLREALAGDDVDLAFAAAFALAGWDAAGAEAVVLAFEGAEAESLASLTLALAHARIPAAVVPRLRALLGGESAERAIAAAEALAFQGGLELTGPELRYFLEHEDAGVRARAWRLAGLVGAAVPPQAYAAALKDEEPAVRQAALEAGAWCGETGVLRALRHLAESPTPDVAPALRLLAALGGPAELALVDRIGAAAELGPERFDVVATFGSPALIERLMIALEDPDPKTAAAAGAAFERMTGVDVASNETATARPPEGAEVDEFDAEFLEEVVLPDPRVAREAWSRLGASWSAAGRLCRGVDVSGSPEGPILPGLDMASRRDLYLRARLSGTWTGTAVQLEVFPQRQAT